MARQSTRTQQLDAQLCNIPSVEQTPARVAAIGLLHSCLCGKQACRQQQERTMQLFMYSLVPEKRRFAERAVRLRIMPQ